MGLLFSTGLSVAEIPPWEADYKLPPDTIPIFNYISIFPNFTNHRYSGNVSIDIAVTAEKKFIWLYNRGNSIDSASFFSSNMQEIPIKSSFMYYKFHFYVVELFNNITPGNYQLRLQYEGAFYPNYLYDQFFIYYTEGSATR